MLAPGRSFPAGLNFARRALRAIDGVCGESVAGSNSSVCSDSSNDSSNNFSSTNNSGSAQSLFSMTSAGAAAESTSTSRLALRGRAVSVSDHPACCPALDRVAEQLASKLPRGSLRVVCEAREQLMGSLPDEDPDAVQVRRETELVNM